MHGNGCLQSLITPIRSMRWEVLAMWKLPRDHRVILSRALDLSRQHQTKDVLSFRKDMKFWMQLPSVHARKHQVPAQYWFDPLHEGKHGRTLHEHGSPETDSCHPPIGKILWRIGLESTPCVAFCFFAQSLCCWCHFGLEPCLSSNLFDNIRHGIWTWKTQHRHEVCQTNLSEG